MIQSNYKKKHKVMSTSACWKYFTKCDKSEAQCHLCPKRVKTGGGTSNLRQHLERRHPNRKSTNSSTDDSVCKNDTPVEEMDSSLTYTAQPTITTSIKSVQSYSSGGEKCKRLTDTVTDFIITDNMPFSVVDGRGFRSLMKFVAPLYKLPTRNTFKHHIDERYDKIAEMYKTKLNTVKSLILTTDIWTDHQMKSFLGITVHFLSDYKLVSATLGVHELNESHTADYISSKLKEILHEWNININCITAVVSDNGPNIVKAIHDTFGKNRHIPCFAHTLNLVCEKSISNTDSLLELISKIRAVVTWFKKSVTNSDSLRKQQLEKGILEGNIKKLVLDVKTRWNSTYHMCARFIEMAPYIINITFTNVNAPEMLTTIELEILKEVVTLLLYLRT
ncbi:unnamed protein product [Callosobruchus maculatus]|uniref:BED-type domain-containing protein n=1 Tax=Callosobruchus maculatus TaxID=64391 RepID=A0A653CNJ2_CALMS|nr:unnamed protein product [Callosobruchus maculatus]